MWLTDSRFCKTACGKSVVNPANCTMVLEYEVKRKPSAWVLFRFWLWCIVTTETQITFCIETCVKCSDYKFTYLCCMGRAAFLWKTPNLAPAKIQTLNRLRSGMAYVTTSAGSLPMRSLVKITHS